MVARVGSGGDAARRGVERRRQGSSSRRRLCAGVSGAEGRRTGGGLTESDLVEGARERGLAVGGLVLVDHAFAGGLIELTARRDQQLAGLVLVARIDGCTESTDRRVKR